LEKKYIFVICYDTENDLRILFTPKIIGFAGAPWTLMSYMIEGGGSKMFCKVKKWVYKYPEASLKLLNMLVEVLVVYLSK